MLAGLPIVSTKSRGGRDVYFDPEYCAIVDADPRAIRDAVVGLRDRQIPREYIRQQTLKRIEPGRRRFLAMVDELVAELGGSSQLAAGRWPFGEISGVPWDGFKHHVANVEKARGDVLARELGLSYDALADVQLTTTELRPIIRAIKDKPGCSLLVFGCGNDSPMWESLNAGGTTAFIEDDAEWAKSAEARLRSARVFPAHYGTRRTDWQALLRQPAALAMDLPPEIRERQWDVVLVDGPAGYDDERPGRMKSIYEAARLVAPGGKVFLHDCERPVEAAYAAQYLRRGRLCLEVKGRALLRGYAF
jgi:glucuronoxylan 4-O-methyltransferase